MGMMDKKGLCEGQMLMIYAIGNAPDGVPTRTHLQLIMYLALRTLRKSIDDAGYRPGRLGPRSDTVEGWRDALVRDG